MQASLGCAAYCLGRNVSTCLHPDAGLVCLQVRVILRPLFEIGPQIEGSSLHADHSHVPSGHPGFSYLGHKVHMFGSKVQMGLEPQKHERPKNTRA